MAIAIQHASFDVKPSELVATQDTARQMAHLWFSQDPTSEAGIFVLNHGQKQVGVAGSLPIDENDVFAFTFSDQPYLKTMTELPQSDRTAWGTIRYFSNVTAAPSGEDQRFAPDTGLEVRTVSSPRNNAATASA